MFVIFINNKLVGTEIFTRCKNREALHNSPATNNQQPAHSPAFFGITLNTFSPFFAILYRSRARRSI